MPERIRFERRVSRACACGITVRNFCENDIRVIVNLWNACFPSKPMDEAHFKSRICGSAWFSPEGCRVALKGGKIIGFVLASERKYRCGENPFKGTCFIESIGVDASERRNGVGSLLIKTSVDFFKTKGCSNFETSYFYVPDVRQGYLLSGTASDFFGSLGFRITDSGQSFRLNSALWDGKRLRSAFTRLNNKGFTFKAADISEKPVLENAIRRWGKRWHYPDFVDQERMKTYIICTKDTKIVGYCRATQQRDALTYDELDWIWDASVDRGRGSVGFLFVDSEYRSEGIGAVLVAKALDTLFNSGCVEVHGYTSLKPLQSRYRKWGCQVTGSVVNMNRTAGW